MGEETKKLDDYIDARVKDILASAESNPGKAQIQSKYAEAFADAVGDSFKKGRAREDGTVKFAKFAMTVLRANNDMQKAYDLSVKNYPEDKEIQGYFKALTVSTPSEGGFAVPEALSSDIIQFLYPKLAYSQLGSRRVDMPSGNLNLPRFDAKAACSYIGETKAAAATKPVIGNVRGSSKKLSALIPISNDLIRSSNPTLDAFVRDDLVMSLMLSRDYTAFYGAGTVWTPAGISTQLTTSEKTGTEGAATTAFTADVPGSMLGMLMSKNIPGVSYGWAFNGWAWSWLYNLKTTTGAYIYRDEMNKGTLLGKPFVVSNQIYSSNLAAGTAPSSSDYCDIFLGDFSEFIEFVQMDMELMSSKEASYVDELGNTVSAVQNDMTILRALSLHDFGLRHKESFVKGTYGFKLA